MKDFFNVEVARICISPIESRSIPSFSVRPRFGRKNKIDVYAGFRRICVASFAEEALRHRSFFPLSSPASNLPLNTAAAVCARSICPGPGFARSSTKLVSKHRQPLSKPDKTSLKTKVRSNVLKPWDAGCNKQVAVGLGDTPIDEENVIKHGLSLEAKLRSAPPIKNRTVR